MRSILTALLAMASTQSLAETYFAHVNADNVVDQVIVADPDIITQAARGPAEWVQTYMTPGPGQPKNYAGIGYAWNPELNCFVPPKPAEDVVLDQDTCQWASPRKPPP